MIVCICMRVSDREIRSRIGDGAASVEELQLETGCGTRCGKCLPHVERELQGRCGVASTAHCTTGRLESECR